jgi:hypothetical protein
VRDSLSNRTQLQFGVQSGTLTATTNASATFTGTTSSNQNTISSISGITGTISVGMLVTGANIPAGTFIVTYNAGAASATLSNNVPTGATATITGTLNTATITLPSRPVVGHSLLTNASVGGLTGSATIYFIRYVVSYTGTTAIVALATTNALSTAQTVTTTTSQSVQCDLGHTTYRIPDAAIPQGASNSTHFIVHKPSITYRNQYPVSIGGYSNGGLREMNVSNTTNEITITNVSNIKASTTAVSQNAATLVTGMFSNYIVSGWNNGTPMTGTTTTDLQLSTNAFNTGTGSGFIGSRANTMPAYGLMSEYIQFNRALQNDERQQVEGYLAWKWGLVQNLPVTHPYYYAKAPQSAFQPTNLPLCALWLDAADRNSISSNVTQWNDKSGNNRHFVAAGSSLTPTFSNTGFLGAPGVQFTRASATSRAVLEWTNNATPLVTSDITVMMLVRTSGAVMLSQDRLLSTASTINGSDIVSGGNRFGFINKFGTYSTVFRNNNSNATSPSITSLESNGQRIITMTINKSTLTSTIRRTHSSSVTITGSRTGESNIDLSLRQIRLGTSTSIQDGTNDFDQATFQGFISEVLIYNSVLSTTQLENLEGYIAWKYNLASSLLHSTHPYYVAAPVGVIPTSMSGSVCQLWLDASDLTTLSLNLTQWNDKSGNGVNYSRTFASTTVFPTYEANVQNSLPGIRIANNEQRLGPAANFPVISAGQTTIFNAMRILTGCSGTFTDVNSFQTLSFNTRQGSTYDTNITNGAGGNVGIVSASSYDPLNKSAIFVMNTNGGTFSLFLNGAADGSITGATTGNVSMSPTFNRDVTAIGSFFALETIIYSTSLSTAQRQQVEGYLGWKWGLQSNLPTTHPFTLANYFFNNTRPFHRNFVPPDIEGCQLWIDAADSGVVTTTNVGTAITQWTNKAGSNHFTTLGGSPTYAVDNQAGRGVRFVGNSTLGVNSDYMASTNDISFTANSTTIFLVASAPASITTFQYFLSRGTADDSIRTNFTSSSVIHRNQGLLTTGDTFYYNGNSVIRATNDVVVGSASSRFMINLTYNGSMGTVTNKVSLSTIANIGGTASRALNGFINEVIIFSNPPTTEQRHRVEGYLAHKWRLVGGLPSSHPHISSPPSITPLTAGPTCIVWLDAADIGSIVTSNSTATLVTSITDKSGLANNITNAGSTVTYASTLNSRPVLTFPSAGAIAGNTLSTASLTRDPVNYSAFYVCRYPSSGANPIQAVNFDLSTATSTTLSGASNASSTVLTVGSSDGFAVGRYVLISGVTPVAYNQSGIISAISSSTSITVELSLNTSPGTYTTGGTITQLTASQMFGHDGIAPNFNIQTVNYESGTVSRAITSFNYSAPTLTNNTFILGCVRQNGVFTLSTNGITHTVGATGFTATGNKTSGAYSIFGGLQGLDIGEVIVYDSALRDSERQTIEGYLAWKWGIQRATNSTTPSVSAALVYPTTHPYYNFPPVDVTPMTPALRLYKKPFDPSDLSPTIWLDSTDATTTDNRVTSLVSKGSRTLTFQPPIIPYSLSINNSLAVSTGGTSVSSFTLNETPLGVGTLSGIALRVGTAIIPNCTLTNNSTTLTTAANQTISNNASVGPVYSITIPSGVTIPVGATGGTSFTMSSPVIGVGTLTTVTVTVGSTDITGCTITGGSTTLTTPSSTITNGASVTSVTFHIAIPTFATISTGGTAASFTMSTSAVGSTGASAAALSGVSVFIAGVPVSNCTITAGSATLGTPTGTVVANSSSVVGNPYLLTIPSSTTITPSTPNVSQWLDKSGSDNHATPTATAPTFSGNFVACGNNSGFTTPTMVLSATNRISVFVVANQLTTVGAGNVDLIRGNPYSNFTMNLINSTNAFGTYINDTSGQLTTYTTINKVAIYQVVYDSTTVIPYVTGNARPSYSITPGTALTTSQVLNIAGNATTNLRYYEVLFFGVELTTAQREQVEGYLAWKWGMSDDLPSGHTFKTTRPSFTRPSSIAGCQLWLDAADESSVRIVPYSATLTNAVRGSGTMAGVPVNIGGVSIPNCTLTGGSSTLTIANSTPITTGSSVVTQAGPLLNTSSRGNGLGSRFMDFSPEGNYQITGASCSAYNSTAISLSATRVLLGGSTIEITTTPATTLTINQPIVFAGTAGATVIAGSTAITAGTEYFIRSVHNGTNTANTNFPTANITIATAANGDAITGLTTGSLSSVTATAGAYLFIFTTSMVHNIPVGAPVCVRLDGVQLISSTGTVIEIASRSFYGNVQYDPTSSSFAFYITSSILTIPAQTSFTVVYGNVQYSNNPIISGSLDSDGRTLTLNTAMPHNLQVGHVVQPQFFGPALPSQWTPYTALTVNSGSSSTFTGFISSVAGTAGTSGNILTVTAGTAPAIGAVLSGTNVTAGTYITGVMTPATNYYVSTNQNVASTTITPTYSIASFTGSIPANSSTLTVSGASGTIAPGMTINGGVPPGTMITGGSGTLWTINTSPTSAVSAAMRASNYSVEVTCPASHWPPLPSGLNNGLTPIVTGSTGQNFAATFTTSAMTVGQMVYLSGTVGSISSGTYYVAFLDSTNVRLATSRLLTDIVTPGSSTGLNIPIYQYGLMRFNSSGTASNVSPLNNRTALVVGLDNANRRMTLSGFSDVNTLPTAGTENIDLIANPGIQTSGSTSFANLYAFGMLPVETVPNPTSIRVQLPRRFNESRANSTSFVTQTTGSVTYTGNMANYGFTDFRYGDNGGGGIYSTNETNQATLCYPANGYLLEASGTNVRDAFNSTTSTIVCATHTNYGPIRVSGQNINRTHPPFLATSVRQGDVGGADAPGSNTGRDFTLSLRGNAQGINMSMQHSGAVAGVNVGTQRDTTSNYRILSAMFNSTASAMGDVPTLTRLLTSLGWRGDTSGSFASTGLYAVTGVAASATTQIPVVMRLGGNTNIMAYGENGGAYTDIGIAEVLVFNTVLTLEQRQLVEGYLAQKYRFQSLLANGGTAPTSTTFIHPYRLNPTTITGQNTLSLTSTTATYAQNLVAWFDAANLNSIGYATGTSVNSWASLGGSLEATLGPNGTNYPTLVLNAQNGLPGMRFANTGTPLGITYTYTLSRLTTSNRNNEYTVITVYNASTYSSSQIVSTFHNGFDLRFQQQGSSFHYRNDIGEQINNFNTTQASNTTYMTVNYRRGSTMFARINGIQDKTTTFTNLVFPTTNNSYGINLGSYRLASPTVNIFTGDIYEHMIFRSALTDQAIQQVEGYLAWKWGLQGSLPNSHAYKRISA